MVTSLTECVLQQMFLTLEQMFLTLVLATIQCLFTVFTSILLIRLQPCSLYIVLFRHTVIFSRSSSSSSRSSSSNRSSSIGPVSAIAPSASDTAIPFGMLLGPAEPELVAVVIEPSLKANLVLYT